MILLLPLAFIVISLYFIFGSSIIILLGIIAVVYLVLALYPTVFKDLFDWNIQSSFFNFQNHFLEPSKKRLEDSRKANGFNMIKTSDETLAKLQKSLETSVRSDIAQDVQKLLIKFFNIYFDIFQNYDQQKYTIIIDIRKKILALLSELIFDGYDIHGIIDMADVITFKFITIIKNKYELQEIYPCPLNSFDKMNVF